MVASVPGWSYQNHGL